MDFDRGSSARHDGQGCVDIYELVRFIANLEARGLVPDDQFSMRAGMANHAIPVGHAQTWHTRAALFIHNEQHEWRRQEKEWNRQDDKRNKHRQEEFRSHT